MEKTEKKQKSGKGKNIILTILAVAIFGGVGFWYYTYWEGNNYFTTQNAKVNAKVYSIAPVTSGKLERYTVAEGSIVAENEVIGRVENSSYIKSPINGQVIKSNVTLNQMVSPTTVVAVVADTNNLYVQANIEETEISKIKEGQQVVVQIDAYPGKKFKGYVSEIDKATQTALTGAATSFTTSGTYTKVTQLFPVKILLYDELPDNVNLEGLIGVNSTVKIKLKQ